MNGIKRDIEKELNRCADFFPVVTILGPWQSGKTTLARMFFSSYNYVNLEDPEIFNLARNDINAFFSVFKAPLIIDEIQRVPELVNRIQVLADAQKKNGQFILTGSFQQGPKSAILQSLAGRTAIVNLLPFSIAELEQNSFDFSKDEFLYQGFMIMQFSGNAKNPCVVYSGNLEL